MKSKKIILFLLKTSILFLNTITFYIPKLIEKLKNKIYVLENTNKESENE